MPPFPDSPRVIYERNPLEEVICQVKFPPLLRIDAEVPAAFQESIRATFPMLRESRAVEVALGGIPAEMVELIGRLSSPRTAYEFVTADERFAVALSRDFLALTSRDYLRWEEYRTHLEIAVAALRDIYDPGSVTRLGLRYRDVLCRSVLDMPDAPWTELLKPFVAAELSDPDVGPFVAEAKRELLVGLPTGNVRIRHGLAPKVDTGEMCYVMDADFFTEERTELVDVVEVLNGFNRQAGKAFRWLISDRLHEALRPAPA